MATTKNSTKGGKTDEQSGAKPKGKKGGGRPPHPPRKRSDADSGAGPAVPPVGMTVVFDLTGLSDEDRAAKAKKIEDFARRAEFESIFVAICRQPNKP